MAGEVIEVRESDNLYSMREYWLVVFQRAFLDSLDTIGQSLYVLLYALLVVAIESLLLVRGGGWATLKERWAKEGAKLVLVGIVAWVPFFAVSIAQTLSTMHAEARTLGAQESGRANEILNQKVGELEQQLREAKLLASLQRPIVIQQPPSASSQPSEPRAPRLKVDSIPLPSEDGLMRTSLHIWTDIPVNEPIYGVICDQRIVRKQTACGCGFMASGPRDIIGGLRVNGQLWDREKYFLFGVQQPNPVKPDYFIEAVVTTKGEERPRCAVQLFPSQ